jgi:hypothetical protein
VPILFGKPDRRQRDFRGRTNGISREAVSKEKPETGSHCRWAKRYGRKVTADAHLLGTYEGQ